MANPWEMAPPTAPTPEPPAPWTTPAPGTPAPTPSSDLADKLVKSAPGMEKTTNPLEAFSAGMHQSASGLILDGKPNMAIPANASFASKLLGSIGQGIGDLPFMIVGGIVGGAAGTAATAETGPGAVIGGAVGIGAGGMALPQAVRETMMDYYDRGDIHNASDFTHMIAASSWRIGKQAAIGAIAGPIAGKAGSVVEDLGAGAFATTATNTAAFTAAATGAQAAMDHKMPDKSDIAIAAITALGVGLGGHIYANGAVKLSPAGEQVAANASTIYRQTGIPPWEQARLAHIDPKLNEELLAQDTNGEPVMPKFNATRPEEPEPFKDLGVKSEGLTSEKNLSATGLVVARKMPDGTVKYGKPGQMHFDLYGDEELEQKGIGSVGLDQADMGFAKPGGPFMSRAEAAASIGQTGRLESQRLQQPDKIAGSFGKQGAAKGTPIDELLQKVTGLEKSADDAISPRGAIGRHQIMPGTARQYGFDPEKLTNSKYSEGAARHILTDLYKRFKGDEEAILVAYNAGPSRAFRFIRDGRDTSELPNETQHYLTEAGFGGKGGEPPQQPPAPPKLLAGPEGPDFSKLSMNQLRARFQSRIGEKPTPPKPALKDLARQFGSELASVRGIDSMLTRKGLLDPTKDYTNEDMFRMTYSSASRFDNFVMEGPRNAITFDKENGPAVIDLVKHLHDIGGNMEDFELYQSAKRTIQKAEPTTKHPKGIDTGVFDGGVDEAKAVVSKLHGVDYESANALQSKIEDGFLNYFQDSGMLDSAGKRKAAMKSANLNYVSMRRVFGDDEAFKSPQGFGKNFKVFNPVAKMEGSDRQIVKPFTANLDNWNMMIRAADRNRAVGSILGSQEKIALLGLTKMAPKATLAEPGSDVFKPYSMTPEQEDAFKPLAELESLRGTNKFAFYNDGRLEVWTAKDKYVADLMRGADSPGEANLLTSLAILPAKTARSGIVGDLGLLNTVLVRHPLTAALVDPLHPLPIKTMIEGFMDAWNKSPAYYDLQARGGLGGAFMDGDKIAQHIEDQRLLEQTGALDKVWNAFRHPLQASQAINELVSNANKIGYVKAAARKGIEPNKAASMARVAYVDQVEMPTANAAKFLAKAIPFFQPTIRGASYVARMVKDNPKQASVILGSMVATQAALFALNKRADQDLPDNEKYSSLPQWERDNYFVFPPIGGAGGTRVKITRPFVIGPLLSVPTEHILEALDKQPHALDLRPLLAAMASDTIPGVIPQFAKPVLEEATNHNFYSGQQLMSDGVKTRTPDMQYTEATSEVSKKIAAALGTHGGLGVADLSPIVMDNYVNEYSGSLGTTLLHLLDKPLGHVPNPWDQGLANKPFIKSFIVRNPGMNTQQVSDFYEDAKKYEALHADVVKEIKDGMDPEALRDKRDVGRRVQLDMRIEHALNIMGTSLDAMDKRDDMTVDEKRQLSDRIYNDAWHFAAYGSKVISGLQPGFDPAEWADAAQADLKQARGK